VDKNVFDIVDVISKYHFAILSDLMPKIFDVSYLNLRAMNEDERLKKKSLLVPFFCL
jgi:hypothetical protein